MASLVFTAFSFEAFLNHIGSKLFKCWPDLERLSPKEKLNIIAEFLDVPIDYGHRPWQIMKRLFGFRNDIAHGKSITVKVSELLVVNGTFDDKFHALAQTEWQKCCTRANAERAREDVKHMIETLHKACGFKDDFPFASGIQFSGTTGS